MATIVETVHLGADSADFMPVVQRLNRRYAAAGGRQGGSEPTSKEK